MKPNIPWTTTVGEVHVRNFILTKVVHVTVSFLFLFVNDTYDVLRPFYIIILWNVLMLLLLIMEKVELKQLYFFQLYTTTSFRIEASSLYALQRLLFKCFSE